ncbi:MAG: hypothetical protein NT049_03460 [Planctomycetota bacterium]|nr:hypothetical protein [Planctomycetota bacterium]
MKTAMIVVMTLALTAVFGCMSPKGGGMSKDEGFKIQVPMFATDIKQGDSKTINVTVRRGEFFKQDVRLEMKASAGISVTPASLLVKASDTPEVPIQILVPKNAPLSEYRVYVKGTPQTGESTSIEIKVKVVAP